MWPTRIRHQSWNQGGFPIAVPAIGLGNASRTGFDPRRAVLLLGFFFCSGFASGFSGSCLVFRHGADTLIPGIPLGAVDGGCLVSGRVYLGRIRIGAARRRARACMNTPCKGNADAKGSRILHTVTLMRPARLNRCTWMVSGRTATRAAPRSPVRRRMLTRIAAKAEKYRHAAGF